MTISKATPNNQPNYVFAANLKDVESAVNRCLAVQIENHAIVLFYHDSKVYAIDNRCPHMGFPLNRGTVKDGVLTCHWHHARFDILGGGTFDPWAGDVPSFPVKIQNGHNEAEAEVWLDISQSSIDQKLYCRPLLQNGLKQNIPLMIAKYVVAMANGVKDEASNEPKKGYSADLIKAFKEGLEFGTRFNRSGWGQGLTIHTCMMNIVPYLNTEDNIANALYHGLSAVAQDCANAPPRFEIPPLPQPWPELPVLKRWFRQFVESRDARAAERCIVTAVRLGASSNELADMLFAAATDHHFLDTGHTIDFTNKALEALDIVGWDNEGGIVESVLSSLILGYTKAERMEESNAWRHPIDLIAILEDAYDKIPSVLEKAGGNKRKRWDYVSRDKLVAWLLGDNPPQSITNELLNALSQGASEVELSGAVSYAASLRIAQFHTRNEFGDWDAVLHTFTFANAIGQGLRRLATPDLLRGVFDAAMRIYLNRFLNIPPAQIPKPKIGPSVNEKGSSDNQDAGDENAQNHYMKRMLLNEFPSVLDRQQQVNQAGQLAADYLYSGGNLDLLLATMGSLLLREDRNFHSIQMIEGAFKQLARYNPVEYGDLNYVVDAEFVNILVAAFRYLAAHSPTMRSQGRTFQIGNQLYHGKHLFEE